MRATCDIRECEQSVHGRGLCSMHYQRARRRGQVGGPRPERGVNDGPCSVDGCDVRSKARGWCNTHYNRWRNFGSTDDRPRRPQGGPGERWCTEGHFHLEDDFWASNQSPDGLAYICKAHSRAAVRRTYLRSNYGIELSDYERMLDNQQGRCGICATDDPGENVAFFAVDHDHVTGEVRGLLCQRCNRALGLFGDDHGLLRAALDWLDSDPMILDTVGL